MTSAARNFSSSLGSQKLTQDFGDAEIPLVIYILADIYSGAVETGRAPRISPASSVRNTNIASSGKTVLKALKTREEALLFNCAP